MTRIRRGAGAIMNWNLINSFNCIQNIFGLFSNYKFSTVLASGITELQMQLNQAHQHHHARWFCLFL